MGREEAYTFNLHNFYDDLSGLRMGAMTNLPLSSPIWKVMTKFTKLDILTCIILRWLIFSLFYSYIVIVPLCYTRIYKLRKAMKKMGNDFEKRQKRNVVTFRYNMFIWAAELASVSVYNSG